MCADAKTPRLPQLPRCYGPDLAQNMQIQRPIRICPTITKSNQAAGLRIATIQMTEPSIDGNTLERELNNRTRTPRSPHPPRGPLSHECLSVDNYIPNSMSEAMARSCSGVVRVLVPTPQSIGKRVYTRIWLFYEYAALRELYLQGRVNRLIAIETMKPENQYE